MMPHSEAEGGSLVADLDQELDDVDEGLLTDIIGRMEEQLALVQDLESSSHLVRKVLPVFVERLFCKCVNESFASRVHEFFQNVIKIMCRFIDSDCIEVLATLCLLLDGKVEGDSPGATFYTEHGNGPDEEGPSEARVSTLHVGRQLEVYESESKRWYRGSIIAYSLATGLHEIKYDHGPVREQDLSKWKHIFLEASSNPERLQNCASDVGTNVKIFWPRYEKFYSGRVEEYDSGTQQHNIRYDDGDMKAYDMTKKVYEIEPTEGAGKAEQSSSAVEKRVYALRPRGLKRQISLHRVGIVNRFCECGGIDAMQARGQRGGMPPRVLRLYMRAIYGVRDLLVPELLQTAVSSFTQFIFAAVLGMSDEGLKAMRESDLDDILLKMGPLLYKSPSAAARASARETIDKFALDMALMYLRSSQLQKRLVGLSKIKDMIGMAEHAHLMQQQQQRQYQHYQRPQERQEQWADTKYIGSWLLEHKIVEELLGDNMHTELVKRSGKILNFLASWSYMKRAWLMLLHTATIGVHEAVRRAIFGRTVDLVLDLTQDDRIYLFECVSSLPYEAYDEMWLYLVFDFTRNVLRVDRAARSSRRPLEQAHYLRSGLDQNSFGFGTLWDFVQDSPDTAKVQPELTDVAVGLLVRLWSESEFEGERAGMMQRCIDNLKTNISIPQSLQLLERAIRIFPQTQKAWFSSANQRSIWGVIEHFNTHHALLDLFFDDLVLYHQKILSQMEATSSVDDKLENCRYSHLQQVQTRLNFLTFCLKNSSLVLNEHQSAVLWLCLVEQSVSDASRDVTFEWLSTLQHSTKMNQADPPGTSCAFVSLPSEVVRFVFMKKMTALDSPTLTLPGFRVFRQYFYHVNDRAKLIKSVGGAWYTIAPDHLVGVMQLWAIARQAQDEEVGRGAINLLNQLHHNLSSKLKTKAEVIRAAFVRRCLEYISEALLVIRSNGSNAEGVKSAYLCVWRCVDLLRLFVNGFHVTPNTPVEVLVQVMMDSELMLMPFMMHQTVAELRLRISSKLQIPGQELCMSMEVEGREVALHDEGKTLHELHFEPKQTLQVTRRDAPLQLGEEIIGAEELVLGYGFSKNGDKYVHSNATDNLLPLPHKPDMTLVPSTGTKGKKNIPVVPLSFLSTSREHFEQLFLLLDFQSEGTHNAHGQHDSSLEHLIGGIAPVVWEVLQLLPTNGMILNEMRTLQVEGAGEGQCQWDRLLDTRSLYKLGYRLQIVDAFMQNEEQPLEHIARWCSRFIRNGGVEYLANTVLAKLLKLEAHRPDQTPGSMPPSMMPTCFGLVCKLLRFLLAMDRGFRSGSADFRWRRKVLQLRESSCFPEGEIMSRVDDGAMILQVLEVLPKLVPVDALKIRSERVYQATDCAHGVHVAVHYGCELVAGCILSGPTACKRLQQYTGLTDWLWTMLLATPSTTIHHESSAAIQRMCSATVLRDIEEEAGTAMAAAPGPSLLDLFMAQSVPFLDAACSGCYKQRCHEYFGMLCSLHALHQQHKCPVPVDLDAHFADVLYRLLQHKSSESFYDPREVDQVLVGLLKILRVLCSPSTARKERAASSGLVRFLFQDCLFACAADAPASATGTSHIEAAISSYGTKCKSAHSRAECFALLSELCLLPGAPADVWAELVQLIQQHATSGWERDEWNCDPHKLLKEPREHAGLSNQGATCYINSLVQQLYHQTDFADSLLDIDLFEEEEEKIEEEGGMDEGDKAENEEVEETGKKQMGSDANKAAGKGIVRGDVAKEEVGQVSDSKQLAFQLQVLFGYLRVGQKRCYDTVHFCKSIKDTSGAPIVVSEQKDVNEFCQTLFDQLEKSSEKVDRLIKGTFYATLVNQILGTDGVLLSATDEPAPMLSVQVKNKQTLQESLELFISGDNLSGDNQYMRQDGSKVDAVKRSCIKVLPDILIIHLKRFEFDLETLTRRKVNDRNEFPVELDMYPYTVDGLRAEGGHASSHEEGHNEHEDGEEQGEGATVSGARSVEEHAEGDEEDEGFTQKAPLPRSHYEYELQGVVAHVGTVDSGHYYSFVEVAGGKYNDALRGKGHARAAPRQEWVEFNDRSVIPFGMGRLEEETFGGSYVTDVCDPQTGTKRRAKRERNNNAYLLFYKRRGTGSPSGDEEQQEGQREEQHEEQSMSVEATSVLGAIGTPLFGAAGVPQAEKPEQGGQRKQGEKLRGDKLEQPLLRRMSSGSSAPLPPRIMEAVWKENLDFLNEQHLISKDFIKFIWNLMHSDVSVDVRNHQLSLAKIGTQFVVHILCHARAQASIPMWFRRLKLLYAADTSICHWFFKVCPYTYLDYSGNKLALQELMDEDNCWFEQMLFACPHSLHRRAFADLLLVRQSVLPPPCLLT
jgi:ubiquitin C-terminal hydrolase